MADGDEARAAKRPRTEPPPASEASSIFSRVMARLSGSGGAGDGQPAVELEDMARAALAKAAEDGEAEAEEPKVDEDGNRILPEDFPEEYVNVVRDCVEIEVDGAGSVMQPLFTHQVFTRDQYVLGYKNLKAKFSYTKRWRVLIEVSHEGALPVSVRKPDWEVDKEPLQMVRDSGIIPINGEDVSATEDPEVFARWKAEDQQVDAELALSDAEVIASSDTDELLLCKEVHSSEERRVLMSRMQAMSFWWIETAQQTDTGDARWSLFVVRDTSQPLIVGFLTLFEFYNPVRGKRPLTWRICQVVVLPALQRRGVGQRVVKEIYARAIANGEVHEVNVEEPCPAFVRLRDAVEVSLCLENNVFSQALRSAAGNDAYNRLSDEDRELACRTVKITRKQAQRCFDMLQLLRAEQTKDDAALRKLRLALKRRIFSLNVEGVQNLPRENLKRNLELLYDDLVEQFHSALRRVPAELLAQK